MSPLPLVPPSRNLIRMNKRLAAATVVTAALTLTACTEPPEPRDYLSPTAWDEHIAETDLTCNNNQWREYPLIDADHVADCRDENGADILRSMHPTRASVEDRLEELRFHTGWHEEVPAFVDGGFWLVQCVTVEQCETWAGELGGEVLTAPDY